MTNTELKCEVINHFGDGQHPWADKATIDMFANDYLLECIDKAIPNSEHDWLTNQLVELKEDLSK
jgi:hypothetical protein|tara:strand:- start:200 stop:394 length:195 start_codon:yes stop_codon:yes gene_type:complete